jgi:putative lipoic acid-binding regulatory protein
MNKDNSGCKPEINYPCQWQFRLIGEERSAMMAAIGAAVDISACEISDGNVSSGGRYLSVIVETTVADEAERLDLYQRFAVHPAIKLVL